MDKCKEPKLPDDPKEALNIIAAHIENIVDTSKVLENGVLVNFSLYWQLHGYAYEAKRIADQSPT